MSAVLLGEPISSSELTMKTRRPTGSQSAMLIARGSLDRAAATDRRAVSACRPARSPAFMSATPGPRARPSRVEKGRAAAVPGSKTVSV